MIENKLITKTIIDGETIAASGDYTSGAIDLSTKYINGEFSLQFALTGDGTATIEYLVSNDGVTFLNPTGSTDIVSSFTSASGTAGKDLLKIPIVEDVIIAKFIKIKVTETSTTDSITVTAVICYR